MMLTLAQASKATKKSRSTLSRAIKSGKLSASRDDSGTFLVDTAELARVYRLTTDERDDEDVVSRAQGRDEAVLRVEVQLLRTLVDDLRGERERLLKVIEEQNVTVRQLTHQPEPRAPKGWGKSASALLLIALTVAIACAAVWLGWQPSKSLPPAPQATTPEPPRPLPKRDDEPWHSDDGG